MSILNWLFRREEKSSCTDSKHNKSQQHEKPSEKSLRIDFLNAIRKEDVEGVKTALEAGADPNCIIEDEFALGGFPFYHGEVPLIAAVSSASSNTEIIKILLGTGAYPSYLVNEALMKAASNGNAEIVDVLLSAGADSNYKDSYGRDALISVALRLNEEHNDRLPVIDKLLKSGADPNHTENNFQSAIQLASYHGHIDTVKMILNSGLITETFNLEKALDSAENEGNQEICVLIKNHIEKVNSETEPTITKKIINTNKDTIAEITIDSGEMISGETVDVTLSVEGHIHGSDLYNGKYHAKLPVDMISDQLLNHIADKIGVIADFHMGYMLVLNGKTILTCREKKALRDTEIKDGDILTFIDWG